MDYSHDSVANNEIHLLSEIAVSFVSFFVVALAGATCGIMIDSNPQHGAMIGGTLGGIAGIVLGGILSIIRGKIRKS
jgi:hypothetical protein